MDRIDKMGPLSEDNFQIVYQVIYDGMTGGTDPIGDAQIPDYFSEDIPLWKRSIDKIKTKAEQYTDAKVNVFSGVICSKCHGKKVHERATQIGDEAQTIIRTCTECGFVTTIRQ